MQKTVICIKPVRLGTIYCHGEYDDEEILTLYINPGDIRFVEETVEDGKKIWTFNINKEDHSYVKDHIKDSFRVVNLNRILNESYFKGHLLD